MNVRHSSPPTVRHYPDQKKKKINFPLMIRQQNQNEENDEILTSRAFRSNSLCRN